MNKDFSHEALLASIGEAEQLAGQIETLEEGQEKMRLIYRWAETVDNVALMMVQAEELLSEGELVNLQEEVNKDDAECWEKYRRNIRWLNKPSS